MFNIVELKDTVSIPPNKFNMLMDEAIADQLNKKMANKVIIDVGLGISLFDIIEFKESFIHPGDASAHVKVYFRFVVFRPFVGEVIYGKLRSCSLDGVHVSLGFFDDIIIPPHCLPEPYRFDEKEQVWVWEYELNGESNSLFMDIGETVRFKVKEEIFTDTSPAGPTLDNGDLFTSASCSDATISETKRRVPYLIKGSFEESGLGLVSWWK